MQEILRTPSGKIELAPDYVLADIPRLLERLDRPAEVLVMTSRRHLRSNNSWMHQMSTLVGGSNTCTLLINPRDAANAGVADGELVRVTSEAGSVEVVAEVSDEMMPGVVSLPHGWGHTVPGAQTGVPEAHVGVNTNLLAPGRLVDVPSGNAVVNGYPVTVTRCEAADAQRGPRPGWPRSADRRGK